MTDDATESTWMNCPQCKGAGRLGQSSYSRGQIEFLCGWCGGTGQRFVTSEELSELERYEEQAGRRQAIVTLIVVAVYFAILLGLSANGFWVRH